jgi:hypothetical protein
VAEFVAVEVAVSVAVAWTVAVSVAVARAVLVRVAMSVGLLVGESDGVLVSVAVAVLCWTGPGTKGGPGMPISPVLLEEGVAVSVGDAALVGLLMGDLARMFAPVSKALLIWTCTALVVGVSVLIAVAVPV